MILFYTNSDLPIKKQETISATDWLVLNKITKWLPADNPMLEKNVTEWWHYTTEPLALENQIHVSYLAAN